MNQLATYLPRLIIAHKVFLHPFIHILSFSYVVQNLDHAIWSALYARRINEPSHMFTYRPSIRDYLNGECVQVCLGWSMLRMRVWALSAGLDGLVEDAGMYDGFIM